MKIPFLRGEDKGSYKKIGSAYLFDRFPKGFFLKEDLPPAVQRVADSIVRVYARDELGARHAGTGLDLGGVVLTALHTVQGATKIDLSYEDLSIESKEVARSENLDLALLASGNLMPASDIVFTDKKSKGHGELYAFGYLFFVEAREGGRTTYIERLCAYKIKSAAARYIKDGSFAVLIPIMAEKFFLGFSGGMVVDSYGSILGMILRTFKRKIKIKIWGTISLIRHTGIIGAHSGTLYDFLERCNNGQFRAGRRLS